MQMQSFKNTFVALAVTVGVGSAAAENLFVFDNNPTTSVDRISEIDTTTPGIFDSVDQDTNNAVAGFEWGGGLFYAADTNDNNELFVLEPGTGTLLDTIIMTFPTGGDVITSLEFIGDTLYGGFTTEGGGPSSLVTIDTTTGDVAAVGAMGIDNPTGGLAWDGTTLYTVNSGAGGSAILYTVDTALGTATEVGAVQDESGAPVTLTGLEFGTDGVLYALGQSADSEQLFTVDPATGTASRIGDLGTNGATSITAIPEPASLGLLLLAAGLLRRR